MDLCSEPHPEGGMLNPKRQEQAYKHQRVSSTIGAFLSSLTHRIARWLKSRELSRIESLQPKEHIRL
jgi:hypothetical protein